jgi:hypothetical protein
MERSEATKGNARAAPTPALRGQEHRAGENRGERQQ